MTKTISFLDVSRETTEKLKMFEALLGQWTKTINLIAPATVDQIWQRHIEDCAQLLRFAPLDWRRWVDLGSGGGLPGLVVAILETDGRPITLVESDVRKCLFLNTVRRELDLNVTVVNKRIEAADLPQADVISARALAPLPKLLEFAHRILDPHGQAFFMKGERFQVELDQAAKDWQFDLAEHQSLTNDQSRILQISGIKLREH